jgi:hypothetical protein
MASRKKLRIIVGGLVGQFPLGGVAWDYFHYCLGLHELGHDVYYHEDTWVWPYDPIKRYPTDDPDYTVRFIRDFFNTYAPDLAGKWHYLLLHDQSFGMTRQAFDEVARTADIFLNVSGACFFPDELNPKCVKVFLDTDPGYNQIMLHEKFAWSEHVERWCKQVAAHDRHLTYAENIYEPDCVIPRMDFDWQVTRPIVSLAPWRPIKENPPPADAPFTTIMTWDYFRGELLYKGVNYQTKVPEFEKFKTLPQQLPEVPLELAIGGHKTPVQEIREAGWRLADAQEVTITPSRYLDFIRNSQGEWSVAKNVYVDTRSGWFSCRTACYLAAGRPAVVQDTGWSRHVPAGQGLFAFSTSEQAIEALRRIQADPAQHRAAAYEIARQYLAADRVLPPMIEAIFATPRTAPTAPGPVPPGKSTTGGPAKG